MKKIFALMVVCIGFPISGMDNVDSNQQQNNPVRHGMNNVDSNQRQNNPIQQEPVVLLRIPNIHLNVILCVSDSVSSAISNIAMLTNARAVVSRSSSNGVQLNALIPNISRDRSRDELRINGQTMNPESSLAAYLYGATYTYDPHHGRIFTLNVSYHQ